MSRRYAYRLKWLLPLLAAAFCGCALVDEDLRDCETDYTMDYDLRLVTNLTTEIRTQFGLAADVNVASAITRQMGAVFSDHAYDVNLSFYDVEGDRERLHHEKHIMDASQSSYTLFIPVREYMHLALANLESNLPAKAEVEPLVKLEGDGFCGTARLQQPVRDTVESHSVGLYTARLPMALKEGVDQQFNVNLYMANCASALVIDTLDSHIKKLEVLAAGFATAFDVADSTYLYQYTPVVRTRQAVVEDQPNHPLVFTCVNFPSRTEDTKTVIDTTDPDVEAADKALWYYIIHCTMPNGNITETKLGVRLPLLPGQFKIITADIISDGSAVPEAPYVGASVKLNWNPGMDWEVEM